MIVPKGALQRRIADTTVQANRESASAENRVRGIILDVYSIKELSPPNKVKAILEGNPGLIVGEISLLSKEKVYVPLDISPDQKEMLYGNNVNLRFRPVEIRFFGGDVSKGRAYITSDPLLPSMSEYEMPKPFDVFGGIS